MSEEEQSQKPTLSGPSNSSIPFGQNLVSPIGRQVLVNHVSSGDAQFRTLHIQKQVNFNNNSYSSAILEVVKNAA